MTTNRIGELQLVRYTPMLERLGVLPVHQLSHVSGPNGGAMTCTISEVLYGSLPDEVEVAVEQWTGTGWVEERDGRFSFTSQNVDKADVAGMVKITAQALVPWMGEGANLDGVEPLRMNGLTVVGAKTLTGVSSSGSTLTKSNHGLFSGDRVRIEEIGKMSTKAVKSGGVYFVRNLTSSTFQLAATLTGAIVKSVGTSSGDIKLERLRDQISAPGHPFKNGDKVRVLHSDGSGLSDGSSYYIVRDGGVAFGLSNEVGGPAIELNSNTLDVYRDLDGERVFKGTQATAGYIAGKAFAEAQTRGWAPAFSRDFSGTADSSGLGWVDVVEDEPGIPIGFKPGTSLTALLNYLVSGQIAEYSTQGRMLRLHNYGFGVERSLGNTPVTLGLAATAKPVKRDLNSVASHIRVRGEGPVQVDVAGTPGAFGRREMYLNASGVTTAKLAIAVGNQKLKTAKVLTQYAITESAVEARFLAGRDFFRGDYVLAHVSRTSGTPERFRVVEIQKQMDDDGNVDISIVLGDRITTSVLARLAAKAREQAGGISSGGNGAAIPVVDMRKPAAPVLNEPIDTVGVFSENGAPQASITATWSGVTTDIDGLDIYVTQYEMWVRADGKLNGSPVAVSGGLIATSPPYASGQTMLVSVRAQSSSGVYGPFSDEVEVVTAAPLEPPNPPTQPTATSLKGIATIGWNGLLVDSVLGPQDPELGFDHVYFDRAPDVAGVPGTWATIGGNLGRAGEHTDASVEVGETYWYRAIALTTVGVASQPSAPKSLTIVGVGDSDLDPSFLATFTDGKNAVTFATVDPPDPDPDAATRTVDDLWFKRLGTVATGLWAWDGDSWEARTLDNAVLGTLDVAKLVAGAATIDTAVVNKMVAQVLSAGRVNSQMMNVGTRLPAASPTQRVPAPPTDVTFWADYTGGVKSFTRWGGDTIGNRNVTAGTGGLVFTPTALLDARLYVMQRAVVPSSRKVRPVWAQSGSAVTLVLVWFDAAGTATEVTLTLNATYEFPSTAVEYTVRGHSPAGAAVSTVAVLDIFEAIGNVSGGQFTELTPGGYKAGNSDGTLVIDLTVNAPQVFALSKMTAPGIWDQTMSIDAEGNISGNSLHSATTLEVAGTDVIGAMDARALYEGGIGDLPLLERIGWGEVYTRSFVYPSSIAGQFYCVAEGVFTALEGRQYEFRMNHGKVEVNNPTTENLRLELLISSDPISITTTATTFIQTQFLVQNQGAILPIPDLRAQMKCLATVTDEFYHVSPGSVYWVLRFHFANAFTGGPATVTSATTGNRMITIHDTGPARAIPSATSGATSGTQATTAPRTVQEFDCTWSATWLANGSKVTNSIQFENARSLYSGSSNTGIRSSAVGFPALGMAGRTITKAEVWLQNRYAQNSTVHCYLGTVSNTTEPATIPTRSNTGETSFQRGQGKWVTLPTSAFAGLAAGTIRGVAIGYVADTSCFAYFDGFGQEKKPKLRITSEA